MNRKKIIKITIPILITALVIIGCLVLLKQLYSPDYFDDIIIEDPSGNGKLIIREYRWLFSTGAEIYYKGKYSIFKQKLGETLTDEYCPFHDGGYQNYDDAYLIKWNENSVDIQYYAGYGNQSVSDISTWTVKSFELP